MSASKKFNYDGKDFYDAIGNLASRDFNDSEIALHIGSEVKDIIEARNDKIMKQINDGVDDIDDMPELEDTSCIPDSLSAEVFSRMKSGNYEGWNEQENKLRSMLISQVLERARSKLVLVYKGVYDKIALGKWKTKSVTTTTSSKVNKEGERYEETVTTETTQDLAPNLQALTMWRFHHDKEFREEMAAMKKMDVSVEADKGIEKINISVAYNKKEDLELQENNKQ
ncbi:MAG: hypothetical protein MJZ41_07610 [Bacteroidaceae bacterium]|nr:hypothetical protein [Bacteroidaceae bacterium]